MQIYTGLLTAGQSFTPTREMNILYLAYQVSGEDGDSATLTGSAVSPVDQSPSVAVPVPAGGGDTFVDEPNKPVSDMTITCVQGTVGLRIGY